MSCIQESYNEHPIHIMKNINYGYKIETKADEDDQLAC